MTEVRAAVLLLSVAFACGPEAGFADPELRSRACGNTEPLRMSGVPGGFGGLRWIGESYSVVTADETTSDGAVLTFASYAVEPCGRRPEQLYAEGWAVPAGDGWVVSHLESFSWSAELGRPAAALPVESGWLSRHAQQGLFVLDGAVGDLLLFESPQATPIVVADDVDPDAIGRSHDVLTRLSPPFAIVGDLAWYVSDTASLVRVDVRTGGRASIASPVSAIFDAPWNEIVVFTSPLPERDGSPWATTTILRTSSGESVELPGAVQNLSIRGFVTTSALDFVAIHDLVAQRTQTLTTAGTLQVVHAEGDAAWVVVEHAGAARWADVIRVDMQSGAATVMAERVGQRVAPHPDPSTGGILLFAGDPEDPRGYGRILRISDAEVAVVADDVSPFHQVAADGRVLYVDYVDDPYEGKVALRVRNPDGRDRWLRDDAYLYDSQRIYGNPATDPGLVDLQGDVLYSVHEGPDRGLWRMPFEE